MMQLSFAYLFAVGLIAGLVLLARRNRKQGWRKQRQSWFEAQADAAVRAFEKAAEEPQGDLQHFADLHRLRQSLVAHGEAQAPAPVERDSLETLP